jgi:hypothetical protein
MWTNKVFGFLVCSLSLGLGACAYSADETAPTGEQSSELVAADTRIEQTGSLPSFEVAKGKELEQAANMPTFEVRSRLERAGKLPGYPANIPGMAKGGEGLGAIDGVLDTADEYAVEQVSQAVPVGVERSRTTIDLEMHHDYAVAKPSFIKLSGGTPLVSAGDPCKGRCGR